MFQLGKQPKTSHCSIARMEDDSRTVDCGNIWWRSINYKAKTKHKRQDLWYVGMYLMAVCWKLSRIIITVWRKYKLCVLAKVSTTMHSKIFWVVCRVLIYDKVFQVTISLLLCPSERFSCGLHIFLFVEVLWFLKQQEVALKATQLNKKQKKTLLTIILYYSKIVETKDNIY